MSSLRFILILGFLMTSLSLRSAWAEAGSSSDDSTNSFTGEVIVESKAHAEGSQQSDASSSVTYVSEPSCNGHYAPGKSCLTQACEFGDYMVTTPVIDGVKDEANAVGWCPSPHEGPDLLPSRVRRAFQRVPVPAAVLAIQPPKGKTLVGLETILSTRVESFVETLTMLGRRIQLTITPASFTWHHGDGTTQSTDWAGRPYNGSLDMDDYITHTYEHTGAMTLSVTVTWTATWRTGNSPWRAVDGTVTHTGTPVTLRVVEAEPELVAP